MPEAKVIPQGDVYNFNGHGNEAPTSPADAGTRAACTNLVIVGHVYIEDQFLGNGTEGSCLAKGLPFARVRRVNRTDFKSRRDHLDALFA